MSCCAGKVCGPGSCSPSDAAATGYESRYPKVAARPHSFAAAQAPAKPQFEDGWPEVAQQRDDAPLPPFTFAGANLAACNFPLGGFGSGQIILQGDGTLQGWTVLNQADLKGDMAPCPSQNVPACFFAVSAAAEGEQPHNFILATPQNYNEDNTGIPSYREAHVTADSVERLQALPGIRSLTLQGQYPIADIAYDVPGLPVALSLEAMSPLIPGEASNSAFPGAVFTFTARNDGPKPVTVRLMESQMNFVGWNGVDDAMGSTTPFWGGNVNTPFSAEGLAGLMMSSTTVKADAAQFGTVCVAAVDPVCAAAVDQSDDMGFVQVGAGETAATVIVQAASEQDLWEQFVAGKEVPPASAKPTAPSATGSSYCGGVVQTVTVPPGASKSVAFILTWHFANRLRDNCGLHMMATQVPAYIGAKYATWFADAQAVAVGLHTKSDYLLPTTRLYRDTIYGSTLPENLVQSAAARVSIIGCPTMFWSKDGIVMGCEGNQCCPLNCSHVYGYTVLLERLFPELAQDMQFSAFVRVWSETVGVMMRYGTGGFAIDGGLACIIKTYLTVQQSDGKLTWLPTVWPNVKKMMDILFKTFDVDGDGCIRVGQQNTYDSAMLGANTFIGSYYVTALRAAAAMAELMKEPALAKQYSDRAALSSANYEKICWKEEFGFYIADVTIKDCANSYGPGCFVDQLCAGGLSFACGLGYMFNEEHEARARASISANNICHDPPFKDYQRHFFPGDSGHLACSYPHGKLGAGMKYDTLVSIGWSYPVIAGLLHDNNIKDAMSMNDMIRQRQDGRNRSPWNEPECNTHYSRQMGGWGLYDQSCGLRYDSTQGLLGFEPRFNAEDFCCFFTADGGWGKYTQKGSTGLPSGTVTVAALHGAFTLKQLGVFSFTKPDACTVLLDGKAVIATLTKPTGVGSTITFESEVTLAKGSTLSVQLRCSV